MADPRLSEIRGWKPRRVEVVHAGSRTGEVALQPSFTDVAETARVVVEEYRPQIEAAGLELAFDADSSIAPIETDGIRVRQILCDLIYNAASCTERGRVGVWVARSRSGRAPWAGEWLAVNVSDRGRDVPEQDQHIVFQELARREPARAHGSKHITDAFDVRITMVGDPGRGSTFTLWLPVT
jgi:signal transduction histidine kinase